MAKNRSSQLLLARPSSYNNNLFLFQDFYEEDAVIDSIVKELLIEEGSYIFDPEYGTNLLRYIFEPYVYQLKDEIITDLENLLDTNTLISSYIINIQEENVQEKSLTLDITIIVRQSRYNLRITYGQGSYQLTVIRQQ